MLSSVKGKKIITFSFDDGVTQDERLVRILNEYGLKATFNLNSSFFGLKASLNRNGHEVTHNKNNISKALKIYEGHEIAVHTLTHPQLPELDDETIVYQVEKDRETLSNIFGVNVVGMAYPGGGINNDERIEKIIREKTGVKYARTIQSTYSFAPCENLYRFNPTVYYIEVDKLFSLAQKFLENDYPEGALFYIWGHSYEMDAEYISWQKFEEFCRMVSGKKGITYCTNKEALLTKNEF